MARTIVIRITVDNRDALNAIRAQREEQRRLNDQVAFATRQAQQAAIANARLAQSQAQVSQLQNGLTNSFIKGNLAARAISATYLTIRDSLTYLIGESAKYELNLARISAVTGNSGKALDSMNETIMGLSRNVAVSTNEIAGAALELAKLGFAGQNLEVVLGGVAKLSSVLGDSLEATGMLVGGVIQAFNLTVDESATVADKLFVATGKSASNIEGFKVAFSLASQAAEGANITFEEFAAAVAALSNQGIRASTIGTGFRNFIGELSKEGSKAQKALGGSIEELGLLGAIEKLSTLKLSPGSIIEIFGKPGSPVAAGFSNAKEQYVEFLEEIKRGEGRLDEAKDKINDTLISQINLFKNALVEVVTYFSKDFLDGLTMTLQSTSEKLNAFADRTKNKAEFTKFVVEQGTQARATKALGVKPDATDSEMFFAFMEEKRRLVEDRARQNKLERALRDIEGMPERGEPDVVAGSKKSGKVRGVKDILDDFERLKADFEVFQTFGGEFDFTKTVKEMEGLAQALLKIGERMDAVKVMREIQDIRKQADKTERAVLGQPHEFEEDAPRIIEDDPKKFDRFMRGKEAFEKRQAKDKQKLFDQDKLKVFVRDLEESLAPTQILIDNIVLSMDALSESTSLFGDLLVNSFLGHADAFSDFQDAFGNMAKAFVSDLIAMELRILAFKAALRLFSLFTGGGAEAVLQPGAPDLLGGIGATLAAKGFDGVVNQPRLFVAGEAGPERVKITPMSKMGVSDGGGSSTTIIVQGDVFNSEKLVDKIALTNERSRSRYV